MAGLPQKYDKRLRRVLGYRAVWEPGSNISLGDIVTVRDCIPTDVSRLSDWGVTFRKEKRKKGQLKLSAQGVSETLIQGNAELPSVDMLKPSGKAELKIKFGRANTYHLRTTELTGHDIGDLTKVGRQVAKLDGWSFRDYWIVWKILQAKDFTFLGSVRKNREISLSGSGKALAKHLELGASAGISMSSSSSLDLELSGTGGPIAIGLTRVKKNGRLRDV